jgi:hypothetical protein
MMKFSFPLSLRRLSAVILLLPVSFLFSCRQAQTTSNVAHVPTPTASKVEPQAPAPTGANIYVDEAMLSKPYAIIGGTVENISGEKLENLSVEIELKRRDGGSTERREVSVQPGDLDPGKQGKYSLKVLSDEWGSSRVVSLHTGAGNDEVTFKSLPGAKRPPERIESKVMIVKTPHQKKSNGDNFINTPDTPIRVP